MKCKREKKSDKGNKRKDKKRATNRFFEFVSFKKCLFGFPFHFIQSFSLFMVGAMTFNTKAERKLPYQHNDSNLRRVATVGVAQLAAWS